MDVQINEVTFIKELKAFIHFPFSLYQNNPCWVPNLVSDDLNTLRWDKNPAFETCQHKRRRVFIKHLVLPVSLRAAHSPAIA